jgi:hypothetical protein
LAVGLNRVTMTATQVPPVSFFGVGMFGAILNN